MRQLQIDVQPGETGPFIYADYMTWVFPDDKNEITASNFTYNPVTEAFSLSVGWKVLKPRQYKLGGAKSNVYVSFIPRDSPLTRISHLAVKQMHEYQPNKRFVDILCIYKINELILCGTFYAHYCAFYVGIYAVPFKGPVSDFTKGW